MSLLLSESIYIIRSITKESSKVCAYTVFDIVIHTGFVEALVPFCGLSCPPLASMVCSILP